MRMPVGIFQAFEVQVMHKLFFDLLMYMESVLQNHVSCNRVIPCQTYLQALHYTRFVSWPSLNIQSGCSHIPHDVVIVQKLRKRLWFLN